MTDATRVPRSLRTINPKKGLHGIKRDLQKKFMAAQCEQLVTAVDETLSATFAAAPDRRRPYLIARTTVVAPRAGREAFLERSLFEQWSRPDSGRAAGLWNRIVAFQVNLPAKKRAEGWGEIDLLGVRDGLPVVIELKRGQSAETPAGLLVQAAAYGVALQRAWWFFREEWLQKVRPSTPVPTALFPCRLVCLAPDEYWQQWHVAQREADAVAALRRALAVRGLPSMFAAVDTNAAGEHSAREVWPT